MESQPQNPELRINPENYHPCVSRKRTFCPALTHPLDLRNFLSSFIRFVWSNIYFKGPQLLKENLYTCLFYIPFILLVLYGGVS